MNEVNTVESSNNWRSPIIIETVCGSGGDGTKRLQLSKRKAMFCEGELCIHFSVTPADSVQMRIHNLRVMCLNF